MIVLMNMHNYSTYTSLHSILNLALKFQSDVLWYCEASKPRKKGLKALKTYLIWSRHFLKTVKTPLLLSTKMSINIFFLSLFLSLSLPPFLPSSLPPFLSSFFPFFPFFHSTFLFISFLSAQHIEWGDQLSEISWDRCIPRMWSFHW